jgi:anaerobic C4-dicarboxylate transporter
MSLVSGFTLAVITYWTKEQVMQRSTVFSAGLGCFFLVGVAWVGSKHVAAIAYRFKRRFN